MILPALRDDRAPGRNKAAACGRLLAAGGLQRTIRKTPDMALRQIVFLKEEFEN